MDFSGAAPACAGGWLRKESRGGGLLVKHTRRARARARAHARARAPLVSWHTSFKRKRTRMRAHARAHTHSLTLKQLRPFTAPNPFSCVCVCACACVHVRVRSQLYRYMLLYYNDKTMTTTISPKENTLRRIRSYDRHPRRLLQDSLTALNYIYILYY